MDSQLSNAVSDVLIRFLDDFLQLYLQPCPNGLKIRGSLPFTLHQPHFLPHIYLLTYVLILRLSFAHNNKAILILMYHDIRLRQL